MKEIQRKELELREKYKELLPSELFNFLGAGITISGPSGTGKTTVGIEISVRYQLPSSRFVKVGAGLREELGEKLDRPIAKDISVDDLQALMMKEANRENPFVLEGRLSGIIRARIAKEFREKGREMQPIVSVLLICEEKERMRRLNARDNKGRRTKRTLEKTKREERKREKDDIKKWKLAHPDWNLKNPFNPGLKLDGKKVYQITIDTTNKENKTIKEAIYDVILELDKKLLRAGLIEKVVFQAPVARQNGNGKH